MDSSKSKKSRVPTTRLGRLARLGLTAGELAIGGAAESIRRFGKTSPDEAYNALLTATNAKKLANRLAGMRGAAMKMGQILSMESADFLPREFSDALAVLRDSADTMPLTQIKRVMGREYGKGWQDRFIDFNFEPIAAASIGQVHRVVTEDGRDLALKIQYPGVAKSINSDVDNMAMLMRMINLLPVEIDISGIVKEAKRQLHQEADYIVEARYLREYKKLVADEPRFVVPGVHDDMTTKRVLAMDFVDGLPLESISADDVSQELKDGVGALLQHLMFRELFEFRTMQSDPNFANYLYQPETDRVVLLDFGSTVSFDEKFTHRYAKIARAMIDGDDSTVRRLAEQMGYIHPGNSEEYVGRILNIIRLASEPVIQGGVYDFGASTVFTRGREAGLEIFFDDMSEYRVPPPETMFLHRKLVGCFMLCSRIGARVDVQKLISPFLPE
ncbi:MAG: AarF/ABC1/UbiB kinase family protein [Xanthomonadales bacterium]|nr:AarF/ABC1/UbiB kinase family protein [Xanthomonadales bacterium]